MKLPLFQVDAFAARPFAGNPAAVVPLQRPLPEATMQAIAAENNLSETAFVVLGGAAPLPLRWFTPLVEVNLCGHATLATAWVLLREGLVAGDGVRFATASGELAVHREAHGRFAGDDLLFLDAPAWRPRPFQDAGTARRGDVLVLMPGAGGATDEPALLDELAGALGAVPREAHRSRDVLLVFESEAQVRALRPDMARLAALDVFGIIATARGAQCDFVSRFFAPRKGVPEDPVTGSAHCTLTPFWAARLQRTRLHARQVSARGGELLCELRGERVSIGGRVAPYLRGEIDVPDAG